MNTIPFEDRRKTDPQGVIDDLLAAMTRQAKTIHDLNLKLGCTTTQSMYPKTAKKKGK